MRKEIVLIGPMKVGKSTIAEYLSVKLKKPHIRVDSLREHYFIKLGLTKEIYKAKQQKLSEHDFYNFCRQYELPMINQILNDYQECIFDFGGGFFAREIKSEIVEVKNTLSEFTNSFMILPSADLASSMFVLNRRQLDYKGRKTPFTLDELKMNSDIIKFHLQHDLTNHNIFNENKTVEETCDLIMAKLSI